jgi:hypothetical protein
MHKDGLILQAILHWVQNETKAFFLQLILSESKNIWDWFKAIIMSK